MSGGRTDEECKELAIRKNMAPGPGLEIALLVAANAAARGDQDNADAIRGAALLAEEEKQPSPTLEVDTLKRDLV